MMKKVQVIGLAMLMLFSQCTMIASAETTFQTDLSKKDYNIVRNGDTEDALSDEKAAINAMRKRALYPWTFNSSDYLYRQKYEDGAPSLTTSITLTKGDYRGNLYQLRAYNNKPNEGDRENWFTSAAQVQTAVNNMVNNKKDSVEGTDCSSSVSYAWRSAIVNNDRTNGMLMSTSSRDSTGYHSTYTCKKLVMDGNDPKANADLGYGNYVKRVGKYGQAAEELSNNTYTMLMRLKEADNYQNGKDLYYWIYAQMRPGDFLVAYRDSLTHARLVEKVIISQDPNDSTVIDPDNSYVYITEQTSSLRNCKDTSTGDQFKTTWRVRFDGETATTSKHTFRALASTGAYYLPYRYTGSIASVPINLIVTPTSDDSVNVEWMKFDEDFCSGYELNYSTDPSFEDYTQIQLDDNTKNSAELSNLNDSETYYIRVRSYYKPESGEIDYSGFSDWVTVNNETGELDRQNSKQIRNKVQRQEYVYNDVIHEVDVDELDLFDEFEESSSEN